MSRDMERARAAWDLREALGLSGGEPLPPAGPVQPPRPQMPPMPPMPPPGAPRPQGGALTSGMPQQRPAMSPLQGLGTFKSPPLAAALQGATGREGPVGFADGGFVVVRRGDNG